MNMKKKFACISVLLSALAHGCATGNECGGDVNCAFRNATAQVYPVGARAAFVLVAGNSYVNAQNLEMVLSYRIRALCPDARIVEQEHLTEFYGVTSKPRLKALVFCGNAEELRTAKYVPLSAYGVRDGNALIPNGPLFTVGGASPTGAYR